MKDEQYWFYVKHGVCPRCKKQNAAPNRKFCADCLYKMTETSAQRYHNMTQEEKQKRNEHLRMRYQERKSSGLCVTCGKKPPLQGQTKCLECRAKCRKNSLEYKRRKGALPRILFGDGYHCVSCGADVYKRKLCDKCSANAIRALTVARENIVGGWRDQNFSLEVKK
ncbi:putative uncharacterized protein [Ruminococcus sp. CAG:330]|nr:putative uncharacterized protein [Ruminococcus sp. CAG:330]